MKILCNLESGDGTREIMKFLMNKFPSLPFIPIKGEREFFQHLDESADLRDEIAVMGGDGTVNMAVQKLFGTKTALGIIPTGHGNDFAKELGLPTDPEKALKTFVFGEKRLIDLGKINGRFFCNSVGIGFDGEMIRIRRSGSYMKTAFKNLFNYPGFQAEVEITNHKGERITFSKKMLMITFANGRTEGGGLVISKGKNLLTDGLLGLTLVDPMNSLNRLIAFPYFFGKGFDRPKAISHLKIRKATVKTKRVSAHVDGETYEKSIFRIESVPKAITVIGKGVDSDG